MRVSSASAHTESTVSVVSRIDAHQLQLRA
jgi:hypothetical protein